jgi:hypothetical protein
MASGSRKVVESGLKDKIIEKNHQLGDFFDVVSLKFIRKEKQLISEVDLCTVICKNMNQFLDKILKFRELTAETVLVRIGIDGGGGFLKICLSVFMNSNPERIGVTRRLSYDEFPSKIHKDPGVKKVFILSLTPVQENYENVSQLWTRLDINSIKMPFTIATDLKLANILLGLMAHGSMYPCCWCTVDKHNLQEMGELRTFGMLKQC